MPFFTRVFRSNKDSNTPKKLVKPSAAQNLASPKPSWSDAWLRTEIAPAEVQVLLRGCTQELKARALHAPFLLLPFRPSSDPSAPRAFIRNYFSSFYKNGSLTHEDELMRELRLTDPMVLCSVLKWCWSRLPGGVVTWEAYELFRIGEQDSGIARDAFSTFIPISADSDARATIIFDFFDLLAAIAAHGKANGLGGRKLSRYAGWWAFEHTDKGSGFDTAYKDWAAAADATSHLFFAYLRSISPDVPRGLSGISTLPIALQDLVHSIEYPPEAPSLLQISTTKVIMIVDTVSPTPFALLRRAKNFEYRDSDPHLKQFSSFEDPIQALTDECLRVLRCISATNESGAFSLKTSASLPDASWSRFEDMGFDNTAESEHEDDANATKIEPSLRSVTQPSGSELGRPTTPSWAEFLSSGFADDSESTLRGVRASPLLPPDKLLPPIPMNRGQSSQSHKRTLDVESSLEPGELASITTLDLDDSFWWVWISSLAGEEPVSRRAVFGRCTLLETVIKDARWLVLEEQVKGAALEPEADAYIVEKKRFFGFSRHGKLSRRKSSARKMDFREQPYGHKDSQAPQSKTSIAPDQHARIQAAAATLQKRRRAQEQENANSSAGHDKRDTYTENTNSALTLQASIMTEASQAMKWAKNYDKDAYRSAYLRNARAGTGSPADILRVPSNDQLVATVSPASSLAADQLPNTAEGNGTSTTLTSAASSANGITNTEEAMNVEDTTGNVSGRRSIGLRPRPTCSPMNTGKGLDKQSEDKVAMPASNGNTATPHIESINNGVSAVAVTRAALEGETNAPEGRPRPKMANDFSAKKPVSDTVRGTFTGMEELDTSLPLRSTISEQASSAQDTSSSLGREADPPRSHHAIEADTLSRVGTNEQDAANCEFSRFDQGSLIEKSDAPVSLVSEVVSARVRELAAPREKQFMDSRNGGYGLNLPAEVGTRDSETSSEENIESRVARIRARVARLTQNMEAAQ